MQAQPGPEGPGHIAAVVPSLAAHEQVLRDEIALGTLLVGTNALTGGFDSGKVGISSLLWYVFIGT